METRHIILGNNRYQVIDLTHPLRLDVEVYPGDPRPLRKVFTDITETGFHHYIHEIGDHHFQPHGDAPNHQDHGSQDRGFESFGLEFCFNPACLIDLSRSERAFEHRGTRFLTEITQGDLEPYGTLLAEKGAVILRTGYDRHLEKNLPHNPDFLPYLSPDAAEYLASFRNLKVVGTDSMTIDPDGEHTAHTLLKDRLIVECLVNLHSIPPEKWTKFDLQTSPVRIVGATGGPVVAYAIIED